jgi:hypothetical protein
VQQAVVDELENQISEHHLPLPYRFLWIIQTIMSEGNVWAKTELAIYFLVVLLAIDEYVEEVLFFSVLFISVDPICSFPLLLFFSNLSHYVKNQSCQVVSPCFPIGKAVSCGGFGNLVDGLHLH